MEKSWYLKRINYISFSISLSSNFKNRLNHCHSISHNQNYTLLGSAWLPFRSELVGLPAATSLHPITQPHHLGPSGIVLMLNYSTSKIRRHMFMWVSFTEIKWNEWKPQVWELEFHPGALGWFLCSPLTLEREVRHAKALLPSFVCGRPLVCLGFLTEHSLFFCSCRGCHPSSQKLAFPLASTSRNTKGTLF